jgi:hypothetical protein
MDSETARYLRALKKVNIAMLDGLKLELITMKTWDDTEQVQRESIIGYLKTIYRTKKHRQRGEKSRGKTYCIG